MLVGVTSSTRELGLGQPQDKELPARVFGLNEFECGFGFAVGHRLRVQGRKGAQRAGRRERGPATRLVLRNRRLMSPKGRQRGRDGRLVLHRL